MNILILGGGKVGSALAEQLNQENHEITLIDIREDVIENAVSSLDIQGLVGNGSSYRVLQEAGIADVNLVIAVTDRDETSLLSCLVAKKAGRCNTIARVRNPIFYEEVGYFKEELGLAMAINPEYEAAAEIVRLIQIPSALEVNSFAKGRVNLIKFQVKPDSPVKGRTLSEINKDMGISLLVCYIERAGKIIIPTGQDELRERDFVSTLLPHWEIYKSFKRLGIKAKPIKDVMIAGGGEISYYLAKMLLRAKISVKIIEINRERCVQLSEELPGAVIIHGDAGDQKLLQEEGIEGMDAFMALTDMDEENVMLSLYVGKVSQAKRIVKINRSSVQSLLEDVPVGSVFSPKDITAEQIVRYVRSMQNSMGSNVEALSKLEEGRVEALEFIVKENRATRQIVDIPLMELNARMKDNLLVCCISRNGKIITPTGKDVFRFGDSVIVVTTHTGLKDFMEIFKDYE